MKLPPPIRMQQSAPPRLSALSTSSHASTSTKWGYQRSWAVMMRESPPSPPPPPPPSPPPPLFPLPLQPPLKVWQAVITNSGQSLRLCLSAWEMLPLQKKIKKHFSQQRLSQKKRASENGVIVVVIHHTSSQKLLVSSSFFSSRHLWRRLIFFLPSFCRNVWNKKSSFYILASQLNQDFLQLFLSFPLSLFLIWHFFVIFFATVLALAKRSRHRN